MPRKKSKKKTLTKKQFNILYECWKNADNTKDRLVLIEENLPKVPSLAALSIMRRMAKTDPKWLKMTTRKKNKKEKERIQKQKERENKKIEKEKRRIEREEKRKKRNEVKKQKNQLAFIREKLSIKYSKVVTDKVGSKFFFCPDTHQFVNNISCIFRIFSNEHSLSCCSQCERCLKFNKHILTLEEIIENDKRTKASQNKTKRVTRDKASSRSKNKKQNSAAKKSRKTKGNLKYS
jgi:hypothetical protein